MNPVAGVAGVRLGLAALALVLAACQANLDSKDPAERVRALKGVTDQRVLLQVALEDLDWGVRRTAAARLSERDAILRVIEHCRSVDSWASNEVLEDLLLRLKDDALNLEVAFGSKSGQSSAGIRALRPRMRRSTERLLFVAARHPAQEVREEARELADVAHLYSEGSVKMPAELDAATRGRLQHRFSMGPVGLATRALTEREPIARAKALLAVEHDAFIQRVSRTDHDPWVRLAAIYLMDKESERLTAARADPSAVVRRAVVESVADRTGLLQWVQEDPSPAVRAAIVQRFDDADALLGIVENGYHTDVRKLATERLRELAGKDFARALQQAAQTLHSSLREAMSAPPDALLALIQRERFDVVIRQAVRRVTRAQDLVTILLATRDHEVARIAFAGIVEPAALRALTDGDAVDGGIRIAASVKAGSSTWEQAFAKAGDDAKALGDTLTAVALFGTLQPKVSEAVEAACVGLIRRGDESRLGVLIDLLGRYGTKHLAEDYMNCGQPDLANAGLRWAQEHGYDVTQGAGSARARWGGYR